MTDSSRIKQLIERPSESLSVEIKRWIDPDKPEGVAKIVRASLALRNHDGGYLVIGFNNDTFKPCTENMPADIKIAFHIDKIQGMVSKYSSEPFEISVEFPERDGQCYPVIIIPPGVKTPVAVKSDLIISGTKIISTDDVYVRSLQANNIPSTTKAIWKDWPKIVEICFDNREADIGRFLRRHLSGVTPEIMREFASSITEGTGPEYTTEDLVRRYLHKSEERYKEVVKEKDVKLPEHGSWEVALLIMGDIPEHKANKEFLNLLDSSNPNYTGWPVWLISSNFSDRTAHPYVVNGVWETLIVSINTDWIDHVDFMILDPKGKFYLRRPLTDDIAGTDRSPAPLTELDFGLPIIRSAEAIAVGIVYAKAMGCNSENTLLAYAFRWKRLQGRELSYWAQPGRYISPERRAYQDEVEVSIIVPLETPLSALHTFVNQVVQPLYNVFDGFSLGENVVEELTQGLIERRM